MLYGFRECGHLGELTERKENATGPKWKLPLRGITFFMCRYLEVEALQNPKLGLPSMHSTHWMDTSLQISLPDSWKCLL